MLNAMVAADMLKMMLSLMIADGWLKHVDALVDGYQSCSMMMANDG